MTNEVARLTALVAKPLNPVYFNKPAYTPAIDFLFDFWCGELPWGDKARRALCQQLFADVEFMAAAAHFDIQHGHLGTDNALTQSICEEAHFSDEWLRAQREQRCQH